MGDVLSVEQRAFCMSRIRGKGTKPEMTVRRILHRLGYRYRLHVGELPGRPDVVFRRRRSVVLVHGCFWHRHKCRNGQVRPATRVEFWNRKFNDNLRRDKTNLSKLRAGGWRVLVIWECQTGDSVELARRLVDFLEV